MAGAAAFITGQPLPEPARVVGTIDREAFAGQVSVQVSHPGMSLPDKTVELKPGETTFEVDDLPTLEHRLDAACVCFISAGTVALRDNRPALLIRDPDGHALLVLGR